MVLNSSLKVLFIPASLIVSLGYLWIALQYHPKINENGIESQTIQFPSNLNEVKVLFKLLSQYKEVNFNYVLLLFSSGYIFKQTYAIPGSALLNVLAGAIFGWFPYGLLLCSVLTAVGATNCFLLSKYCGKEIVKKRFPAQIEWLRSKLHESESNLLFFLISLRLFPASPNWLINMIAPILDIPLHLFFISVLVGLIPYNFLCLKAGETLSEISDLQDIFSPRRLLILFILSVVFWTFSKFVKKKNLSKFK